MTAMPESLADAEHGPKRRRARQEEFPERTGKPVPWSLSADLVRLAVLNRRQRPRQAPTRRRTCVVPAAPVDKGLRQRRPNAVRLLPAVRQAPRRKPDDRGSPVWNPAPRQDRKARRVTHSPGSRPAPASFGRRTDPAPSRAGPPPRGPGPSRREPRTAPDGLTASRVPGCRASPRG